MVKKCLSVHIQQDMCQQRRERETLKRSAKSEERSDTFLPTATEHVQTQRYFRAANVNKQTFLALGPSCKSVYPPNHAP